MKTGTAVKTGTALKTGTAVKTYPPKSTKFERQLCAQTQDL